MRSSRDWAAKGVALLGVRAVLALGFERIHRSNLIGMGVLPVRLAARHVSERLVLESGDQIEMDAAPAAIRPRERVGVRIVRRMGATEELEATAAIETSLEVEILKAGGILPLILRRELDGPTQR
jgi:aconitate hydratase